MRPQPWRAQTRRAEPNERSLLRRTRSLNALRSPILKIGLIARCASVAHSRARKGACITAGMLLEALTQPVKLLTIVRVKSVIS